MKFKVKIGDFIKAIHHCFDSAGDATRTFFEIEGEPVKDADKTDEAKVAKWIYEFELRREQSLSSGDLYAVCFSVAAQLVNSGALNVKQLLCQHTNTRVITPEIGSGHNWKQKCVDCGKVWG